MNEQALRETLTTLLRLFYAKDWVSGTGGGICAMAGPGRLLVAPTGVHKEMVEPADLFAIDPATCGVIDAAANAALKPSECSPIFAAIVRKRGAGSVVHSHALDAVLVADLAPGDVLSIRRFEMLKGLKGVGNADDHAVPVIDNTEREPELTGAVEAALKDPRFAKAHAILVRDHGAYIWGEDVWEAKRHTEVYHFLFEGTWTRR
ncbi:MAG TPA: methylthioribulose 1-phosphate dehydratase [Actinomycetota bacterium]|nr:methylthioribulose 1-phosphate dehydratase [Actinomycetota bacterium]